ncbi:LuxR C-terminal-related transcriptional regulator [Streptomyces sp. Amel2xC10]|uniref:LuxR family transcriptional regulator AbsR2 n=1 Tax=Streptomyces sp. Amel2xC10 TaxID=1305826 RepID=UPI000A084B17|nr:LuxR C-terminal-related transcriptional regulator [Streptomyces sp. Amel2xC10]SME95351.1 Response regulator containing a CheY-like receiver domain and an HTH DNA-binding domain [Streptomyces sp. Amel2xC10]
MSSPTLHGVTTIEPHAESLRPPWPFTGREEELDLVRRSLAAGRPGVVVTGPAGCGRTRLATEAVRGTDRVRVSPTPETRGIPFGAFAPVLPESVTLHRAVRLLSGVRLLFVDDAHLLDDASAALLHHLAVQGRTRLLVTVTDGAPAPAAVTRLRTGESLPRLALAPLPDDATDPLLEAAAGGPLDPLTAHRLRRLCRGDLRLLRDLTAAVHDAGLLTRLPETGLWAWRGPVPPTPALRERVAAVLARPCPEERETLDRLAFAEPLALPARALDLRALERLEADALIEVADDDTVRLAHPLHGPMLRATVGRLRARRLTGLRGPLTDALGTEATALLDGIARDDVRTARTPVGEWLVAEGAPVPAGYAAVRARFARLRGELREAAAWAREGLSETPGHPACRRELALTAARSGDPDPDPDDDDGAPDDLDAYDAVRLGAPERALELLPPDGVFARHARALARADGAALDRVAAELAERGFLLYAAEAYAQAASAHRDPTAARTARTRAAALARRCQGARTPALSGPALGELTARQRQIVTLAAAGLTNRQIAERLTLSVRTVGNHLYGAYARLGTADRTTLPWLMEHPDAQPA